MSVYSYKALDVDGKTVKGKLSADNEAELESKLKQSGLDLISAHEIKEFNLFGFFSSVGTQEMILICIHLHHLLGAGVAILDAIGDLRDTAANPKVREIMMDVYDSLKNGKMLSESLASHPTIFDAIFIGLVRTGEKTGNLAEVFYHLEQHFRWIQKLKKGVKKATMYPLFLFILMSCIIALMVGYVVPKLTAFLLTQNIPLPGYTLALIALSDFMVSYWPYILSTPVIIIISVKLLCRASKNFAYFYDNFKLHLPIMGKILRKIEIARFCHFFALLYKSGISILDGLQISTSVVNNIVLRTTILQIRQDVNEGKKLAKALVDSKQFQPLVTRMFKVGEESGNLEQSLISVNEFFNEEIQASIDALVGALQPLLTLIMGGLLGWIIMAVFGPVYGSFSNKHF